MSYLLLAVLVTINGGATCTAAGNIDHPLVATAGKATWNAKLSERLMCDAPQHEPLDVSFTNQETVAIDLLPARSITVMNAAKTPMELEWRKEGTKGTTLLARRSYAAQEKIIIPVAHFERVLRFVRSGAAPVSVVVGAATNDIVPLPPPVRGGSLYARVSPKNFSPIRATVGGETPISLEFHNGRVTSAGIEPGKHSLQVFYEGDVPGPILAFDSVAEATTELVPLALPPTSGMRLRADTALCKAAQDLSITQGTKIVARRPPNNDCSWTFGGLAAGEFRASLVDARGETVASATISTSTNRIVSKELFPFAVTINGRVTYGENAPAPDTVVVFTPVEAEHEPIEVTTDSLGTFQLTLPSAGTYTIGPRVTDALTIGTTQRSFTAGRHDLHLVLPASSLRVTVLGPGSHPPNDFVELSVTGPVTVTGPVYAGNEPIDLRALPVGHYAVRARQGNLTGSEDADISNDSPTVDISVNLTENSAATLVLRGNGVPVSGATVIAGARLLKENRPGEFDLAAVPEGTPIRVKHSGFLPSCIVRRAATTTLELVPLANTAMLLRLARGVDVAGIYVMGIPGAECGISLRDLPINVQATPEALLQVTGVPAGSYVVQYGSTRVQVTVPGPPTTVTPPS